MTNSFYRFPKLNPHQYSYNSPVNFKDPSGLAPESEKSKRKKKNDLMVASDPLDWAINMGIGTDMTQIYAQASQFKALLENMINSVNDKLDQIDAFNQQMVMLRTRLYVAGLSSSNSNGDSEITTGPGGESVNTESESNDDPEKGGGVKGNEESDGEGEDNERSVDDIFNFVGFSDDEKQIVVDAMNEIGLDWFDQEKIDLIIEDESKIFEIAGCTQGSYLNGLFKLDGNGNKRIYISRQYLVGSTKRKYYTREPRQYYHTEYPWEGLAHEYSHYKSFTINGPTYGALAENYAIMSVNQLRLQRGIFPELYWREKWWQIWRTKYIPCK